MNTVTLPALESIDGELFLQFSEAILEAAGLEKGDSINMDVHTDGSILLNKANATHLVIIETNVSYKLRYVLEISTGMLKGQAEVNAFVSGVINNTDEGSIKEFSQTPQEEYLTHVGVITKEAALALCDEDNEYFKDHSTEAKLAMFFNLKEKIISSSDNIEDIF